MPQQCSRRLIIGWAITFIAVTAVLRAIWHWLPAWRLELTHEHRGVEMATIYAYLGAAFVALGAAWRQRAMPRSTVIVPTLSVLGIMEEWSFVLRLGLTPPRLLNVQLDSFHDLVEVAYRALTRAEYRQYALLATVLTGVVAVGVLLSAVCGRRRIWHSLQQLPWQFVLLAGLLLALAALVDLGMVRIRPGAFWEETLELHAGLAMMFAALACWWAPGEPWAERRA